MSGKWRLLAFVFVAAATMAEGRSSAESIVAAIVTPRDVAVAFVERRMTPLLSQPVVFSGVVEFHADGTLSKRIERPVEEVVSISERWAVLERGGKRRKINLREQSELSALYTGLRAMLAGDYAGVAGIYSVTVIESGRSWLLQLDPLDLGSDTTLPVLTVAGQDTRISRVVMRQSADNWQEIEFAGVAAQ